MLTVTKEITFAAAHRLPNYNGPCCNLHGHEWKVQVTIRGVPKETGMVLDFVELKKAMNERIHHKYDHKYLNDQFSNPTAEILIMAIVNDMELAFGDALQRVRLYETPTSYAEWQKDFDM